MKRRILPLLLVTVLVITMLPLNAFAAVKKYNITVGGTAVTSENANDVFGDGTVNFDESTNTLTLNGAKIKAALVDGDYYGIKSDRDVDLTIDVKEKSNITCRKNYSAALCGIFAKQSLTVTGEELYVICEESKNAYGIVCGDILYFNKATAEIDCIFATETGIGVAYGSTIVFNDSAAKIFGSTLAMTQGGITMMSGTYYMGSQEPSEKYPLGFQYLISFKVQYFTVTWKNYDGTVLEVDKKVKEGTMPVYNGKTPKHKADANYTYKFSGWDREIETASRDTEYTAVFKKKIITKPAQVDENEELINKTDTDTTDVPNSGFLPLLLRATGKKKKIVLKWKKYNNADGYIIYGARCGKKIKKIKTLKSADKVKYTVKKLKKGKYYRYLVVAYKNKNGKQQVTAISKTVHCATAGGKRGNPTGIKVKNDSLSIKKGKTKPLKPVLLYKKKVAKHIAEFRYESSNTAVATVNKDGKIKAKKKGKANIYVYAQNGKYKKIKVTVK